MNETEQEYYNMSSGKRQELYGKGGKKSQPLQPNYRYYHPTTYPATILEPFNNVDKDIVVELDNQSDYELFIKAKKDYTLDIDVQDEDNATIKVEVTLESHLLCKVFGKMIDKIKVRRIERSNGLCYRYYYNYSSLFSSLNDGTLTINVCPEYLVQEMTWFMEMMEMNGFDLVPSKVVVEEEKHVEKWYNKKLTEREAQAVFVFCAFTLSMLLLSVLSIIKWFTT